MKRTYGYCRISRKTQNIDRQVRNILEAYPDAIIRKEAYTGTRVQGRKQFEKILREVAAGDTIVFDSVSRMSRNAEEGTQIYFELYRNGVSLVFLKEHHIDTDTYKKTMQNELQRTGTAVDYILKGIEQYMEALAGEQIRIAFDQAQKEVEDLHQRTREGIETYRRAHGGAWGRPLGHSGTNKDGSESRNHMKKEAVKTEIKALWDKYPDMLDKDVMALVKVSRGTYYKYKAEIRSE